MDKQRIAFIGLGVMGSGMASRLIESGYDVTLYNRTRSKAEEVAKLGAHVRSTPREAAAEAQVVMLSLADEAAVRCALYGEDGACKTLPAGSFILDMSTVSPKFARKSAEKGRELGYRVLDTCVLGNPKHARDGELRVMVGGLAAEFEEVRPLLECIGKDVALVGENGGGATMKLVLNMLMGVQMPALAEAVAYGEKAGLPRKLVLEMIAKSGYSSPVMSFRCGMMGARSFQHAAFKLGLMRKDLMLVLAEAAELGVPLPVSESAYAMLTAAKQRGLGELDVSAIMAFQEEISGIKDYPWPLNEDGTPRAGGPPPAMGPGGRPPGAQGGPPPGMGGMGGPPPGVGGMGGPPPGITAAGGPPEGMRRPGPPPTRPEGEPGS
jgi:3-hydroxyisobutyrate dehydrogenase